MSDLYFCVSVLALEINSWVPFFPLGFPSGAYGEEPTC